MKTVLFVVIASVCLLLMRNHDFVESVSAKTAINDSAPSSIGQAGISGPALASPSGSPFERLAGNKVDKPALILERKERMKKGGYFTPEEYFSMSLTQLTARAKSGDMYARLQLAQQYYFESNSLAFEEGFDFDTNSAELGKKYFSDAAVAGHVLITSVLIQLYDAEGDALHAYAWQLFADRVGANYRTQQDPRQLSAADQEKARQLAAQLFNRAMQPLALTPAAGGIK
ncbi:MULTISPECIES: hypothetical protein [unclassified Janthinobacterium]|uniref:hypothetical protein n=1 Tax=unclassified Janthinobacterium TaxID=2610881 RepID=UPI00036880A4|nr:MULTISPECIES: hypothetical protein [unclassified Janthinobacterium]MEC5164265.1 hypothetical protein [Janthinobacterium sp. CG_S6]